MNGFIITEETEQARGKILFEIKMEAKKSVIEKLKNFPIFRIEGCEIFKGGELIKFLEGCPLYFRLESEHMKEDEFDFWNISLGVHFDEDFIHIYPQKYGYFLRAGLGKEEGVKTRNGWNYITQKIGDTQTFITPYKKSSVLEVFPTREDYNARREKKRERVISS